MLVPLIAALTLSIFPTLDVPYLPQTDALCGGASVAMVYRYWGDSHADVKQFASLVDHRAGGIPDSALVQAVKERGWNAIRFEGSVERLRTHLADRQPIIVLLADGRDRLHYVVVVGATPDHIVIHDPSWGPGRSIRTAEFLRRWTAADFWSLLVLPTPATALVTSPKHDPAAATLPVATECDSALADAIVSIERLGLTSADAILAGVRAQCPASSGPLRELAGVRFAQRRWNEATALARQAVALDPADAYAWDVLGSSLFMQDDPIGALRAWNRIGRPRLDAVRIDGLRRTRYQLVAGALQLEPGDILTPGAFARSRRMLNELPDRAGARLTLRPEADGFATIDVVVNERTSRPHGAAEWIAASARTGIDREASVTVPGSSGQGELWTASWRWWAGRPRVAVSFSAPRGGRMPGVWRVDGHWEAETYATTGAIADQRRESHAHGGLTFGGWITGDLRYAFTGGIDSWNAARRDASLGAAIERRSIDDRLSVAAEATRWIPLTGGGGLTLVTTRVHLRGAPAAKRWDYRAVAGAERASDGAPLALWRGAGEGRARSPMLRAHPLLIGGIIDAGRSSFGRTLMYGSAEGQRWLAQPQLPRIGLAVFADIARASRSLTPGTTFHVDVGAGLRVRVPGSDGALRIDAGHGLRDGRRAVTFGWQF
jgi:Papain-like cysteine protease AvrRpt2